ncbi:MAG: TonB-dependent receptor [Bryobacterales bacterium]|nr:TonB-dependent receptor [Bryobacterales bacterium]
MSRSFAWVGFCLVLSFELASLPVYAQLGTATISGAVIDSTGAAVSGASITTTNADTGFRRETVSNTLGEYSISGLAPGTYDVQVEFKGFKKAEQKALTLQVDQNARIDVTLEVGQVTESIEIEGQSALVDTQSATLGAVIDTQKILSLPLNGRNFAQLALLVPGVNTGAPGAGGAEGFSAAGLRANQNAFLIDGTSNSDAFQNRITVRPNIDSRQEIKIQTNN